MSTMTMNDPPPRPPRLHLIPAHDLHVDHDDRRDLVERKLKQLLARDVRPAARAAHDAEIAYLYSDLSRTYDVPQDVETYDGTLGVSREFVDQYESPVGQLRWLDDLSQRFKSPNDSKGNVSGLRWGSGALITEDLFLTAGHCFRQQYPSWQIPRSNGAPISPGEMAVEMCVTFKYQVDGATGKMRLGVSFPVLELLEQSGSDVDYAILRLGRDASGRLPGSIFGTLAVAKNDVTKRNAALCIIQHPGGKGKKVEAGHLLDSRGSRMAYNDIGTSGGASGAPILDATTGEIVGVHVRGGSQPIGGFNSGTTIGAIRAASKLVHLADA